ncbi:MAG TPA: alpha-aminoadipate/glutamate carrier protein LysW/ArgW [Nitrososphaerales archaeon]|nr:alpha-aminoadipate/glutamate carrier protein LysW/ArgW [Nitrososphaerales archaeon]
MNCIECDAQVAIPADAIQGEIVSCRDCGASFELVRDASGGLLTLRQAELEEEDWGE